MFAGLVDVEEPAHAAYGLEARTNRWLNIVRAGGLPVPAGSGGSLNTVTDRPARVSAAPRYIEVMNAIFFDRDGIINRRIVDDYVKRPDEFEFLPGIFELLPSVHRAGYMAIVITNQRGIGRGLMSERDLEEIHAQMQRTLAERTGEQFDAIYHCPHDVADACDCRKPLPGLLRRAARDYAIDLASSWMIGDSESDVEAGLAAGCHTGLVAPAGTSTAAEVAGSSLIEVWGILRNSEF
jgi:D-glycero-D-manno-heptose 1,7-bisphosphate phosphatase